jgi:hypothetical protein
VNPLTKSWLWKYQKKNHLIQSFLFKHAPRFVYEKEPLTLEGEVPVFTFHGVVPEWFEEQCSYLVENGYRTLSADEFLKTLTRRRAVPRKSVLLTFDDGLKHVWTIIYPLLKKYGLKAVCFLIPGCIPDDNRCVRLTLDDYWSGRATLETLITLGRGADALARWNEIKIMHESGVIDFESHTMFHSLVFTSDRIVDYMNPGFDTHFYGNIRVPLYSVDGRDVPARDAPLGMPIYGGAPRMSAANRFFDDENLRNTCIEKVRREGKEEFFKQRGWRRVLQNVVDEYKRNQTVVERYETPEERNRAIFNELIASREAIEARLRGKRVSHLCYPWFEGANFAMDASKKAGYAMNYFGQLADKTTNMPGDDPFRIARIDEIYLRRLPGQGRTSIANLLRRLYELRHAPKWFGFEQQKAI